MFSQHTFNEIVLHGQTRVYILYSLKKICEGSKSGK